MIEYKIQISKLDNKGLHYQPVQLSIIDQEAINKLLENYFLKQN